MSASSTLLRLSALLPVLAGCAIEHAPSSDELVDVAVQAAVSPQVSGLESTGVWDPIASVDDSLTTSTTVASEFGHCPGRNSGQFMLLNTGHCTHLPTAATFDGWEHVTFRVDNGGDVESVDLKLTHDLPAAGAQLSTLVFTSWDGQSWSLPSLVAASTSKATTTIRVTGPQTPTPFLHVVLGKSAWTGNKKTAPALRWYELTQTASYVRAPTLLSARAVSPTQVDLTWADNSTGEIAVEIWMEELGVWRNLGRDPGGANQTSEPLTGLSPSRSFRFKVRAISASGRASAFSNILGATTPAAPPVAVRLVNRSHYPITAAQFDSQSINLNVPHGNWQELNDPSFLPGSVHSYAIAIQMPQEQVTLSGTITFGLATTTLNVDLTAAQVAALHGALDPAQPGFRCDDFANVFPGNQLRICANGAGVGRAFLDGRGPFAVSDPTTWVADDVGFSFREPGGALHQGHVAVFAGLFLDGVAYGGW